MDSKLKFPTSGYPEPALGPMPLARYADWIFGNLRELYRSGRLEEQRSRQNKKLDGIPFSFNGSAAEKNES